MSSHFHSKDKERERHDGTGAERAAARFRQAAPAARGFRPLEALPPGEQAEIEELRLRAGQPLTALWAGSGGSRGRRP